MGSQSRAPVRVGPCDHDVYVMINVTIVLSEALNKPKTPELILKV